MTFRDREKPKMEKMFDLMFLLCCYVALLFKQFKLPNMKFCERVFVKWKFHKEVEIFFHIEVAAKLVQFLMEHFEKTCHLH